MHKKKREVPFYIYAITIVFSILFIFFGNRIAAKNLTIFNDDIAVERAKVIQVERVLEENVPTSGTNEFGIKDIFFDAELTSGEHKGDRIVAIQNFNSYMMIEPKEVEVGDKVLLYNIESYEYGTEWVFGEYVRTDALIVLGSIFFALLLLLGGIKGFQTILSLTFTILAIFAVFIPAVLSGLNIYFWSIIICLYVTVMSLILVGGVNKKTLSAIVGCLGGLGVAALLIIIMDGFLKLTGLVEQDSVYLLMLNPENPINLKGIFFGAMLIGAMGAIMDVSMSIASSLHELKSNSPGLDYWKLLKSGMNIGKDVMGTMSNTLVLAYIGSSLSTILLLISYNPSLMDLLNREMVVIEILQALVGSMGILFTIPITAIVSGFLATKNEVADGAKK